MHAIAAIVFSLHPLSPDECIQPYQSDHCYLQQSTVSLSATRDYRIGLHASEGIQNRSGIDGQSEGLY